jgi:hypothetical protein
MTNRQWNVILNIHTNVQYTIFTDVEDEDEAYEEAYNIARDQFSNGVKPDQILSEECVDSEVTPAL